MRKKFVLWNKIIFYYLKEERKMGTESKRERFIRIAEARTNKILDMIQLLGNCSSKANYEYTEEDIKKIFGALERELKNTKNRFLGVEQKEDRFTLR